MKVKKISKPESKLKAKLAVYLFAEGMLWDREKLIFRENWNVIRVIESGKEYFINFNLKDKRVWVV